MVSNGSGGVGTGYGTYDSTGQATNSGISSSTHTGSIALIKATNLGAMDGGAAIFKLPSVSGFQFDVAGVGSMCYSVDVSTDNGSTWTNKYGVTATGTCGGTNAVHAKGDWIDDVSSNVGTISSPVWVRILNKASGSLHVHGVKITP
ncbi:hypothetical protein ACDA63_19210 [Uliginosibacterium sp. sgz301328]|uniref:hypothetical protein n=1 Tax=Uliginosibacterium sp. sgz301328 TaxID=3243764 RepID=UPI00359DE0EF